MTSLSTPAEAGDDAGVLRQRPPTIEEALFRIANARRQVREEIAIAAIARSIEND